MANGKKSSLLLIILTLVFILSSCTVPNEDINTLNICYKISEQTFSEGFEKDNLDFFENDKYFVTALENGLYDSCYSKSDFKNRSFYFSTGNKENENKEFQINRCKDTLIAMHLAYTLSYDSENFQNQFMTWYPTIDFYLSTHSEFVYLILEHYDCTEEEIDIIVNSFSKLSKSCDSSVDKYKALDTAYFIVAKYNESSKKSIEFPDELKLELEKYSDYVKENPNEVAFWLGYEINN